jgi:DMSO/TMAO reductase YedYZ molybdopterin-dependent catalytic subunit
MREGAFSSALHDERSASLIGTALGIAFVTAFLTGLISHELKLVHPPSWFPLPTRPVWIYRFTQGLHVASGLAAIPLLLAKLWTVYPRLFAWPPVTSALHALERLSILVLISGAIFQLVTGLLNIIQWYPWKFDFVATHYRLAWITVGSLMVHIAVKAPAIARGYRRRGVPEPAPGHVSRRALLATTASAVGVVTLTTVGQSISWLRGLDLFAPRDPTFGPQGIPINRTAAEAGVLTSARDPGWRLAVHGPRPFELSFAQLAALPQYEAVLPISCVEGWSVNGRWEGVRLRDLLDRAGAHAESDVRFLSLERVGAYGSSILPHEYARDPLTLLATRLNGQPLSIDHGFPARLIAPGRPGELQTKWINRIEVL